MSGKEKSHNTMKVIYIFERRHGYIYDAEMFQMESFLSKGCEVEVWSAVNWKFSGLEMPKNADTSGRTHYIDNKKLLENEISRVKNENCIFLVYPYHGYDYISYVIRKSIKNAGFDFCNITESPNVTPMRKSFFFSGKKGICFRKFYRTLRETVTVFLKNPILKWCHKNDKRDNIEIIRPIKDLYARLVGPLKYKSLYNFVTVEMLYDSFPNYFEIFSKRNVLIHSMSYDEYLDTKDLAPLYDEDYIVYIDDYMIGHSNFKKAGLPFPVSDPEKHLKCLNSLFDEIERRWDCKVIIAAHPKAEYKGDEFCGRDIVYFKTNSLIKDAKMVIMEITTCIGVVMLYEKDYLLIFSSEYFMNLPYMENDYAVATQWLECRKLDIRDQGEVKKWKDYVKKYSKDVGDAYKRQFVISDMGIANRRMYDVIRDIIMD